MINNLYGSRCISANRSLLFNDNNNNKTSPNNPADKTKVNASPQDNRPVEDLVNEPTELKEKSLEINTNKGKLVVTTSSDGKELKNVVLEVKADSNEAEGVKSDDVEDPAIKVRVG